MGYNCGMRLNNNEIEGINVSRVQRKSLYKMPMSHKHSYYEIYYLESGSCSLLTKKDAMTLSAGDFCIIPPRISHCFYYATACTRVNIYYYFDELMDGGKPFNPAIPASTAITVRHIPAPYRENMSSMIDQMINEDRLADDLSGQMSRYLLRLLFLTVLRCSTETRGEKKREGDTIISDALTYITENPAADLTLLALAERAGLSESYFSKKFKSETGIGLKEFVTLTRLKEAEKELLGTDHRIEEIAVNNGFTSGNYFKDCFKKSYGASPRQYRKEHMGDQKLLLSMQNDGI